MIVDMKTYINKIQEGERMTVKDIIIEKMKQVGADGLYLHDPECYCTLSDFMPCDGDIRECFLAMKSEVGE